jgi:hypothetical protein
MRYVLFALLVAGCGSSTPDNGDAAAPDLAGVDSGAMDLPLIVDLAQLDCAQLVACTRACTGAQSGSCVSACVKLESATAKTYFDPLVACAGPACSQAADGSVGPCALDPSSQACITCVMQNCNSELTACQAH